MGPLRVLMTAVLAAAVPGVAGCTGDKPAPRPPATTMSVAAYDQMVNGIAGKLTHDTARVDVQTSKVPAQQFLAS
jgi:hypothetical protein